MSTDLRRLFWLLAIAFALHEAEEWNIVTWMEIHFEPGPVFDDRAARTLLVLFTVLGVGFTAAALRWLPPRAALFALLPLYLGILLGNALTHIFWLFYFGAYAPGVMSSVLLILPLCLLLLGKVLEERAVPAAFVWALVGLALLQPLAALRAGSTLSGAQLALQRLGARLVE